MRKLLTPIFITILIMIGNSSFAQFGGGAGTSVSPYIINSKAHLVTLSTNVNSGTTYSGKYFIMTDDISMSGTYTPIGNITSPFKGNFNGDGHKISNLVIPNTYSASQYVGLFGYVEDATLENIGIDASCSLYTKYKGGGLAGLTLNSTINKCYSLATLDGYCSQATGNPSTIVGGLIGWSQGSTVNNSYSNAIINYVGRASAAASDNAFFGGLIGAFQDGSTLINSYSSVSSIPTTPGKKGSLVGFTINTNSYTNSHCISMNYTNVTIPNTERTAASMKTEQFAIDLNISCSNLNWKRDNATPRLNSDFPILYWQIGGTALPPCPEGTIDNPIRIRNVADLIILSNAVNGGNAFSSSYFIVENNINFNDPYTGTFNPIGNASNRTFGGNFNGNGKVISNLTISSDPYAGLFGNISGATIENLGIQSNITTTTTAGTDGWFPRDGSPSYAGGLIGYANSSTINNCYSISSVSGYKNYKATVYLGGLIGYLNSTCVVNNSYSRSTITLTQQGNNGSGFSGGFVAFISTQSRISNSYSAPVSLGTLGTRGVFWASGGTTTTITNSYSTTAQTGVVLRTAASMKLQPFAIELNVNCLNKNWKQDNASTPINEEFAILYWQIGGTELPTCWEGEGTSNDPFKIKTVADLKKLSDYVTGGNTFSSSYFIVENNIAFDITNSGTFNPIGNATYSFQGDFNGNGKIISNLTKSGGAYVGLFGNILNAQIYNLGIQGTTITTNTTGSYGGGLVANATNSTINRCYVSSSTITGGGSGCIVGGLVGNASNTTINNSYSRAAINSDGNNTGTRYYGGLVGLLQTNSILSNSYSSPTSFSATGVTSNRKGILVGGSLTSSAINNSYYNSSITGGNNTLGTPKINTVMITPQFAIDLNDCQFLTWKFANGTGTNNGLPVLYWQGLGSTIPTSSCWGIIGDGTLANPFLITSVDDLVSLSNKVAEGNTFPNTHFRVENDISFFISGGTDRSGEFSPIGNDIYSFQGIFNGNGKVISNLKRNGISYMGLFGNILNAEINNLGIEGSDIATTVTTLSYGGSLVGNALNSKINGCYAIAKLTGGIETKLGGLIGNANSCIINNCYARVTIDNNGVIERTRYNGGLVGYLANNSSILNSYSAPISMISPVIVEKGLLVAIKDNSSNITNSYYDNTLSPIGDNDLGYTKITNEMKSGCFPTHLNNLTTPQDPIVWYKAKSEINEGYPVLSWQKIRGVVPITPAGFEGNCLNILWNNGHETIPYQVRYVKDLVFISNMVANDTSYFEKFFVLQNDISFNDCTNDYSSSFKPIGYFNHIPSPSITKPFSGNFDGNRKAIANYKFSDDDARHVGIFGHIENATIKDLGISNVNISAKNNVGGLIGFAQAPNTIEGCFVYGYIQGNNNVGGLVGNSTGGATNVIKESFTNVTIDAVSKVGGIVGSNYGTITDSYSNAEIYSSVSENEFVGGIMGAGNGNSSLTNVYSVAKIIRNGTKETFGKISGDNSGTNDNCYSRDNVFVNCDNITPSGYGGASFPNATLRDPAKLGALGVNPIWAVDHTPNINDGYPIFTYQSSALTAINGAWQNPSTASQIVIIPSGVQVKTSTANCPKSAYVKIENGGELNNQTNLSLFGEYNRELFVGKWNLIGLSTNNKNLASLINYTAKPLDNYSDAPYKTIVKRFDPSTNNWATVTTQDINTQFNYGEGILVMPNYSLDANYVQRKSRIVSKGILFNESPLSRPFTNTAGGRFVSLANNYPASINVTEFITDNTTLIETNATLLGKLVYIYDTENAKWNNNLQSTNPITTIKPSEGFFVAASSITGSFTFNKSQIKNTSGIAKSSYISNLIYVNATSNNETREAFLQLNSEAENGFDFNDGLMLFGSNMNAVEPFFRINAGKEAFDSENGELDILKDAFSTLPYMTELDLRSEKVNDLSLNFSNIPSDIHVYLLDSLLRSAQYLNENADYSLKVSAGDNKNRLFVLFSYKKEDVNQFFKPEMAEEIKIWNYNNTLHIEGKDLIRYEIYDILGNRLVEEQTSEDDYQKSLSLKNGIYIVRAYSKTGSKAEKISINN